MAARPEPTLAVTRFDAMCSAIAECHGIDEVKDIRDRAVALQEYAKQALNRENERRAAIRNINNRDFARITKSSVNLLYARTPSKPNTKPSHELFYQLINEG
jgi:spore cortex formation protein SpoVR/YcgB (stage V sporulation)